MICYRKVAHTLLLSLIFNEVIAILRVHESFPEQLPTQSCALTIEVLNYHTLIWRVMR